MRLKSISLSGFRAFGQQQTFDLDADAVIVIGPNGAGKTSLCDGILWGLTGLLPRVDDQEGSVVSEFSDTGEARVALTLVSDQGPWTITRTFDGDSPARLQIEFEESDTLKGAAAEAEFLSRMEPLGLVSDTPLEAIATAISRSVYLQQDLVREFVEADNDRERFDAISDLVGTGQVTQLQLRLEKAKIAWTGATNAREKEIVPLRSRLSYLDAQIDRFDGTAPLEKDFIRAWASWWDRLAGLDVEIPSAPSPESPEGAAILDQAIKTINSRRGHVNGLVGVARELEEQLTAVPPDTENTSAAVERLADELEATDQRIEELRGSLAYAEQEAAAARREQIEATQSQAQLTALAELALQHLGETCPVCRQTIDPDHVEQHLKEMLTAPVRATHSVEKSEAVSALAKRLEEEEQRRATTREQVATARRIAREREEWNLQRDRLTERLDLRQAVSDEDFARLVADRVRQLNEEAALLNELLHDGEPLALLLARAGQVIRRGELVVDRESVQGRLKEAEDMLRRRRKTGELAQRLLDAIREANSGLVAADMERLRPLLNRIYARIDPHPAFQQIALDTTIHRGRGRVRPEAIDAVKGVVTQSPSTVFSSSQLNALAVAIFVTLNLGIAGVPLRTAVLDDPLQSVDDVNLLSLIDLFRRVKDKRQLILTTHDHRFGALLERKLRPLKGERSRVLRFADWTRESGPVVHDADIPPDTQPLKIAVA